MAPEVFFVEVEYEQSDAIPVGWLEVPSAGV